MSHREVVKAIKEALAKIRNDSTPEGDIRAVSTFHNGGVIVELESETLAAWLRIPEGRSALLAELRPTVSFRTRSFPLVAEYLPIQMQIEGENFLRAVEQENSLPENSLVSVCWIKSPMRRSQEQQKAFALIQVADTPTANTII
ncbi:uncharacterized protein EDB91DRAFT_1062825, partial [Suillus paluster]|uniref:uncharacterized protein n=1 Tax=Suillus paluster TaxID=48578 RepID=UPI001B866140